MTVSESGSRFLRRPSLIAIAGCLLVTGGAIAIRQFASRPPQQVASTAAPIVETVSALGRLEPDGELVQVFAPNSIEGARVERLQVSHGQHLRQGDVIAILDTYVQQQAVWREAKRQVEVAQARLAQVKAGAKVGQIQAQERVVDRLQAEEQTQTATQTAMIARLEAERQNAELEDRRYQQLYQEGAVSASLRDAKRLTADTVRESLNEARAGLNRIRLPLQQQMAEARATWSQIAQVRPVDVDVIRAEVAQAQAGVARAKADLERTVVLSPQDGQVLKINTRPGELVGNKGIISLGQTRQMVAVAEVYELDVSRVRVGQSATVTSKNNAFPDELHGKVMEVGLEIDKKDILNTDPAAQFDARVVEVKVRLDSASSRKVAGLTNLSVQVAIDVKS